MNQETESIKGYHAHVYFADEAQRGHALRLREALPKLFPSAVMGRIRDQPVGPHPLPMYQVAFSADALAELLPWLMLKHGELSIIVHPLLGDALPEHRDFPLWLGAPLELRLEVFQNDAKHG